MPPISPPTLTRLDPAFPMLWRDVDTVQFGLEARVSVSLSAPWAEPLLQAMRTGFRLRAFDVVAHGVGAPREAARDLLRALGPVLSTDAPTSPSVWVESMNLDDSRVEARMIEALADMGIPLTDRADTAAIGVVLVHGAASARQFGPYLREDLSHLPVAFEPGGTRVGPLVVPGETPCLSCRDGHERDRDPAWPLLHSQLIGATRERVSTVHAVEAAGLVQRVLTRIGEGSPATAVRVTPDGRRVWSAATFHEECRCRAQSFRSPAGIGMLPVLDDRRHATRSSTAFALRA